MEDIIRVLRVVEYIGPRSQVENQVKRSIHGERAVGQDSKIIIRAATVGLYPDILGMAKEENPECICKAGSNYLCPVHGDAAATGRKE